MWSSQKGKQEASLLNPSPLNCVTFDPEGSLVAVGCWDRAVRVWNWIKQENCMVRRKQEVNRELWVLES